MPPKPTDLVGVDTVIGEGSYFQGRFMVNGTIRIDGKFEGEILKVNKVIVGPQGKVKANIEASNVIVEGVVIGDIKSSTRVMLLSTSRVIGDITTPELIIQSGVIFEGKLTISPNPSISIREEVEKLYGKD